MLPENKVVGCTIEVAVDGKPRQFGEVFSDLGLATAIRLCDPVLAAVGDPGTFHIWHESGLVSVSGEVLYVYGHFLMVAFRLAPPEDALPPPEDALPPQATARAIPRRVEAAERRPGRLRVGAGLSLGEYWVGRRVATHF